MLEQFDAYADSDDLVSYWEFMHHVLSLFSAPEGWLIAFVCHELDTSQTSVLFSVCLILRYIFTIKDLPLR